MISNEKKMQFIHHRAKGESFDRISKAIGVSKPTLIKLAKEFSNEINELEEVYTNDLLEELGLSPTKQLGLFRKRLDTVQSKLDDKKMAAMGTTELVDLELKYFKASNQLISSYNSRKAENRKENLRQKEKEEKEKEKEKEKNEKLKLVDQKKSALSLKDDSPDN
jgi:hypothetical protein